MSRHYRQISENRVLVYGHDNTLGYWYELWDYDKDEEDGLIEEGDQGPFHHKSRNEILNVYKENKVPEQHINSLIFNVPF